MSRKPSEKINNKFDTNPLYSGLIIAFVIFVILVAASIFQISMGWEWGMRIGFLWLAGFWFSFLWSIGYYALFIVPKGWREGIRLIKFQLFENEFYKIPSYLQHKFSPKISKKKSKKEPEINKKLPATFTKYGAGTIESHQTLAIAKNGKLESVAKSGYYILQPKESVKDILDKRFLQQTTTVPARTSDGISIETQITVVYYIKRSEIESRSENVPFVVDHAAVLQASLACSVNEDSKEYAWDDLVTPAAAGAIIHRLARHTLDDLFKQDSDTNLDSICKDIREELASRFQPMGLEIAQVYLGELKFDDRVQSHLISQWQALWQGKIEILQAEIDAQSIEMLNKARDDGRKELITQIMAAIGNMPDLPGESGNAGMINQILQAIQDAVAAEVERERLPREMFATIAKFASETTKKNDEGLT